MSLRQLRARTACDVDALPPDMHAVGWLPDRRGWLVAGPESGTDADRLARLLRFLPGCGPEVTERAWWALACAKDGWREGLPRQENVRFAAARWTPGSVLAPDEAPRFSAAQPEVLAFGRHRGDTTAVLVPEAHFLINHYSKVRATAPAAALLRVRGPRRAVFCGSSHGTALNLEAPAPGDDRTPRELLRDLVAVDPSIAVDVRLDQRVPRREQLRYAAVLDVDGWARTWDALAWKLHSGCVVLSQTSVWESFFSGRFEPWRHVVPVANDFSDLRERVAWVLEDPARARRLARAGQRRAYAAYSVRIVRRDLVRALRPILGA